MIVTTRRKWRLTPRMRANTPAPTSRRHEAGAECAPNQTASPECGHWHTTTGSPECGHWHAHSAKPRMRALARPTREAPNAGIKTPKCGPTTAVALQRKAQKTDLRSSSHLRRALRDGTTSQSLRIGVKKINSTVLLEEPLKTPENLQKQLLDTNFAVCSYSVVLVPAAPNTFQIAQNRIAALLMPLAMLHETKCRQLN